MGLASGVQGIGLPFSAIWSGSSPLVPGVWGAVIGEGALN